MADFSKRASSVDSLHWREAVQRRALIPWLRKYDHEFGRGRFALDEFGEYLGRTVLDVGSGANASLFKEKLGDKFHALDLEDSYKVDQGEGKRLFGTAADLEASGLPFDDRKFDTVLCCDTLEHLDSIYRIYDELFRVAGRHVIISLPNNWPGFLGSLIVGHNRTHAHGYGLPPEPKPEGARHKYFFNLEEACEFLSRRIPEGFRIERVELRFERGKDGLMYMPPMPRILSQLHHASPTRVRRRWGAWGGFALAAARALCIPLRLFDSLVSCLIWGWGDPVRFYNLFCRQIWFVFERTDDEQPSG